MTVQPNGTDAKDIAMHFIHATSERATPSVIKRTIVQAKSLLSCDYTKEEIIKVIDYIIDVKKTQMYSLGYVGACINDMLKELKTIELKDKAAEEKQKLQEEMKTVQQETREVQVDGESKERNRNKSARFGVQCGKRAESYIDLLKEHR